MVSPSTSPTSVTSTHRHYIAKSGITNGIANRSIANDSAKDTASTGIADGSSDVAYGSLTMALAEVGMSVPTS